MRRKEKISYKDRLLAITLGFALTFIIFVLSISYYSTSKSFYLHEFEKLEVSKSSGFDQSVLEDFASSTTDFLGGKEISIQFKIAENGVTKDFFNEKEIIHMDDVKKILKNLYLSNFFLVAIVLAVLTAAHVFYKKRSLKYMTMFYSLLIAIGLVSFSSIMVYSDFTSYFVKMHEMIFTNDLWLMDPATDKMITILKEQFFIDIFIRIVLMFGLAEVLIGTVGAIGRKKYR